MLVRTLLVMVRIALALIGVIAASPAPAQPVAVTAPGATTARTLTERAGDVVNVMDFGAKADGKTDDAPAINRAIAYARAHLYGVDEKGFRLLIPQGRYVVESPINLTMFEGFGLHVDAAGATLIGRTAGKAVVDLTGTRWAIIDGLSVYGDRVRTPSIGIQIARATINDHACSNGVWNDVTAYGQFTLTAVYIMSCETSKYYNLYAFNHYPSADSYGLILDGVNHFHVPSDFVTGTVPIDTPRSFNEPNFFGLMVTHDGGGTPIWMANTARMTVQGGYIATTKGNKGVILYSQDDRDSIKDLSLDMLMETNAIADDFFLTGPDPTPVLDGFRYRTQGSNATAAIFKTDAGIKRVTMRGADIDINGHMSRATVFSDPDIWTFSGHYRLPSGSTAWNLANTHFSGTGTTGASSRFVGDGSGLSGIVASPSSTLNVSDIENEGSVGAIKLNNQASRHGGQYTLYLIGNAFPAIAIQPPPAGGAQATAVVSAMGMFAVHDRYTADKTAFVPDSAGSGYRVNDILTAAGGRFTTPFTMRVAAADGSGAITRIVNDKGGSYSAAPAEPIALAGGHGRGATIAHLTWNVLAVAVTAPGAGYTTPPAVTFATGINASASSTAAGVATRSGALHLASGGASVSLDKGGVAVAGGLRADSLRITPATPASSSAPCDQGQISADAHYVYVCTGENHWKRSALATW